MSEPEGSTPPLNDVLPPLIEETTNSTTLPDYSQRSVLELLLLMAGQTEVPQEFYFWAGMSLIGAALQNRVYFKHMAYKPIRCNLYIFLIGDSGDGKGHAIGVATKVGREAERGEANIDLGGYKGKITGAYLYDMLSSKAENGEVPTTHPLWLQSEELSNSIRTGELARDFLKVVTDLWESHGGEDIVEGTRTHGGKILVDPCVNWIAGSTMTWLKEVIDPSDIDSGFFGRTIVIQGKRSTQPIYEPDTSLFDVLMPHMKQKLETIWSYEGEMTFTDEAREYEKHWYEVLTKGAPTKSFLFPTWKRRLDIVHKFAMILQCGRGLIDDWYIIPRGISETAIVLYTDLLTHYENIIESIILGKSDRKMEKVQAFLRKYKMVTKSRLQSNVSNYGVRKDELMMILNTLLEQDSIRMFNAPGSRTWMVEWIEHT